MRLVYYSIAAVATVLACLLWVFVLRQSSPSPATVAAVPSTVSVVAQPQPVTPAALPLQIACMNGVLYAYRPDLNRWDKTPFDCDSHGKVTRCRPDGNVCK